MGDIIPRKVVHQRKNVSTMPANQWQAIPVYRYEYTLNSNPEVFVEHILRELPLSAYPPGTTMKILTDTYELEPGAMIAYSGAWQGYVVFPAPGQGAVAQEIGVMFQDALSHGYIRERR